MCVNVFSSVFPNSSVVILIALSSLSNSVAVLVAFLMFGNLALNSRSSLSHVFFGVFALLNHSSAGESLFRYSLKRPIFWLLVVVLLARNRCLITLRKSEGWILSSWVPENSGICSSCMIQSGDVCSVGGEGSGVFVGCGGRSGWLVLLGSNWKCCLTVLIHWIA